MGETGPPAAGTLGQAQRYKVAELSASLDQTDSLP